MRGGVAGCMIADGRIRRLRNGSLKKAQLAGICAKSSAESAALRKQWLGKVWQSVRAAPRYVTHAVVSSERHREKDIEKMIVARESLTVQVLAGRTRLWCAAAIIVPFLMLGAQASAGENGPTPSDWESFDWAELTSARATYICLSDQPASWCGQWWESRATQVTKKVSESQSEAEKKEAEPYGPPALDEKPKMVSDADWEALLQRVATAPPNAADFRTLSLRAGEDADPAAMEVLGYAYAEGWGVAQDYAMAYRYYGRAFLAGARHVKPNLDQIWPFLTPEQQQSLKGLFAAAAPADSP